MRSTRRGAPPSSPVFGGRAATATTSGRESTGTTSMPSGRSSPSQNLRLVDLEIYQEGGVTKYAGVWRQGSDGHYLWAGVDWENFTSKWKELAKQNLRLTSLEIYPGSCNAACANQVLMPDNPGHPTRTPTTTASQQRRRTARGLPGTCPVPAVGDRVYYRWPCATFDGSERYVRLSALYFTGAPFTIPFSDKAVERRGPWLYSPGSWHHAIDYSRDDGDTFKILSAAPGKVIHIGWDNWSGNTMVVSHSSGRVTDAFRTIYMHLRNGPKTDCEAAWTQTVPTLSTPGSHSTRPTLRQRAARRQERRILWRSTGEQTPRRSI